MKELSIEEKAQRYDEAIKRARQLQIDGCSNYDKETIWNIFPELKESEDEKIRKEIIDIIESYDVTHLKAAGLPSRIPEYVAWLEKQGNKVIDCSKNHKDMNNPNGCIVLEDFNGGDGFYKVHLDYLNKKQVEEVEEMVRAWNKESNTSDDNIKSCIGICLTDADEQRFKDFGTSLKECLDWLEKQVPVDEDEIVKGIRRGVAISLMNHIDANSKGMCLSNMECEDIENAIVNEDWDKVYGYMKKKFEKPGEQETLCDKCKKVQPSHSCQDITALGRCAVEHEQKSDVKIEPKFKVGQTIKKEGFNLGFTIAKIEDGFYYNDDGDYFPFTGQDNWELVEQKPAWSEEDSEEFDIAIETLKEAGQFSSAKWLKSIKDRVQPQSQWKPTEEQMNALNDVISSRGIKYDVLSELWKDLNKLREE